MSRFAPRTAAARALTPHKLAGIAVAKRTRMTRRSLAVRLVLVVAAAASVATSAPRNFTISDRAERAELAGTVHVRALANERGMRHADDLSMQLEVHAGATPLTWTITSDDPQVPVEQRAVAAQAYDSVDIDLITQCQPERACNAGVTVSVSPGSAASFVATATLTAFGDSSFFFPEDRTFPDDAAVAVELAP